MLAMRLCIIAGMLHCPLVLALPRSHIRLHTPEDNSSIQVSQKEQSSRSIPMLDSSSEFEPARNTGQDFPDETNGRHNLNPNTSQRQKHEDPVNLVARSPSCPSSPEYLMARMDAEAFGEKTWSPDFHAIEPSVITDKVPSGFNTAGQSSAIYPPCSCNSKESIPLSQTISDAGITPLTTEATSDSVPFEPLVTGGPFAQAPVPILPTSASSSQEHQTGPVVLPIPVVGIRSNTLDDFRSMDAGTEFRRSPTKSSIDIENSYGRSHTPRSLTFRKNNSRSSSAGYASITGIANTLESESYLISKSLTTSSLGRKARSTSIYHEIISRSAPTATIYSDKYVTIPLRATLSTSEVQSAHDVFYPGTTGTCITKLDTEHQATSVPFPQFSIANSLEGIKPALGGPPFVRENSELRRTSSMACNNLFVPISMDAPPQQITMRSNHPVPRKGFTQSAPLQTNKFWGNLVLQNRTQGTWTHPYLVGFSNGGGNAGSWGLYISHVNRSQSVFGPGNPAPYYVNPIGIHSLIISSTELGNGTCMTLDSLRGFSVNMNVTPQEGMSPIITFPLLQGMAFVTAVYNNGCPLIQSDVFFKSMAYGGKLPGCEIQWYSVILADGMEWLIYLSPSGHSPVVPTLNFVSKEKLVGSVPFSGYIQIAKNPNGVTSKVWYDRHAGVYPLRASVQASVDRTVGKYQLSWTKGGDITKPLLMFALDHHLQSLPPGFSSQSRSALHLDTTTKGIAAAVVGDSWPMEEKNLPIDLDFAPWSPTLRSQTKFSPSAKTMIRKVAAIELNQDASAQSNLDSMYFSGKGLAKFADMIYATYVLAESPDLARAGLVKLKEAMARFVSNRQINPLFYDSSWGGLVSSCTYKSGDPGCDFGNTYYNDHHFHYSYFVKTAAVIAKLDPGWLNEGTNKAYIDALLRDYANPLSNDPYFPFSRNFDWYNGHSWAHGLFESADGKDQESSSEDVNAAHAEKLWGIVTGDVATEARGNLKLAIMARTIPIYFLMDNNNRIHPPQFVPNKVVGILFENKADHTTYFGNKIEFIQGIHMIPLIPASALTRSPEFVRQEWNQYFSGGRADQAEGGWRGILWANYALYDPKAAWAFFARPDFNNGWLDGGASRTWYLALAAGLGGAPP